MTLPSLCAARDVWFLVSGPDKAGAVGLALSGAGPLQAPAAGVVGTRSTTWLLDRDAATHVPTQLIRLASH
jgi:6-phosphogluconolactonase